MSVVILNLFDQPVDDDRPGGVRRRDPLPSHLTANDSANKMRWGSQRARLLTTYMTWGAMTDDRAGRHIGLTHEQATRRICELLRDGLLVEDAHLRRVGVGQHGQDLRDNRHRAGGAARSVEGGEGVTTALIGAAGIVLALVLCAVMVRDIRRSRTELTPLEAAMLQMGRQIDRAFVEIGKALLPAFQEMAAAITVVYDWAVDNGLVEP